MTFPFEALSGASRQTGLVIGTLIGFAFGYTLERAGFGRAPKLAAQFYGTDLTVLKVMFGAIVTALLGMVVLSGIGLVDFKAVADQAASATFLWPMIAGGFALGVGFIVSGYCPGTSFVAAASGKLDGLAVVIGVIAGQVLYAEMEWRPFLSRFHNSGSLGNLYLWELVKLPASSGPAVLAIAVTVIAIAAFVGAEKLEKLFGAKVDSAAGAMGAGRHGRAVFAGFAAAALAGVAALALPVRSDARTRDAIPIPALALAHRVLEEPWTVRVIDLRPREQCAARRIPGSECVPAEKLADLRLAWSSTARDVVFVGAAESGALPAAAAAFPGRLYSLEGGFRSWEEFALAAPRPPAADASPAERDLYRLRAGIHSAVTGMKAAPPPPVPTGAGPGPRKAGGGGCGG